MTKMIGDLTFIETKTVDDLARVLSELKDNAKVGLKSIGIELRCIPPTILNLEGRDYVNIKPWAFFSYRGRWISVEKRSGNFYHFRSDPTTNDIIMLEVMTDGKWEKVGKNDRGYVKSKVTSISPLPVEIRIELNPEIMVPYISAYTDMGLGIKK